LACPLVNVFGPETRSQSGRYTVPCYRVPPNWFAKMLASRIKKPTATKLRSWRASLRSAPNIYLSRQLQDSDRLNNLAQPGERPRGARAGFSRGYTLRSVDIVENLLSRLDRAQWGHTIRIVHRHYRAFLRGRRGATLRKGRSMMGQARQCTCAEGQRTGRSIDRSEPFHGWLLMR